jgi:hypothetical protein
MTRTRRSSLELGDDSGAAAHCDGAAAADTAITGTQDDVSAASADEGCTGLAKEKREGEQGVCSSEDEADDAAEGEELQVTKLWCWVASAAEGDAAPHGDRAATRTSRRASPVTCCERGSLLGAGPDNSSELSAEVEKHASDGDGDGDGDGDDKDIGRAAPAS